MNTERIPIEELEKLMLEKAFSELSEQEKEFALSQLASPAEYDDLRNTLIQIREVFSEDKNQLKMPPSGKEALMTKFRNRNASLGKTRVIKLYQRKWMWAAAASLLLIVSLIFVNERYDSLKKNQEIALRNDQPQSNDIEEQQGLIKDERNKISEKNTEEEAVLTEQELTLSGSNANPSAPVTQVALEKTDAAKSEGAYYRAEEQKNITTTSAAETKYAAPTASMANDEEDMEYTETESVQTATKKELKTDKTVKGNSQAMPAAGKSQGNNEYRKASIRKSFLCTDI